LLAVFMLGCGGSHSGSDTSLRGVRLAAVIKGLDNPFFVTMRDGLVATARRDGARLHLAAAPTGLQATAGQASELESLGAHGPRCYVVNPINPTNLVGSLARVARDAPIINVDSPISKDAANAVGVKLTTYVGTDDRAGGRLGADAMARLVGRGARVAVIGGVPGDVGSGLRAGGFKQGTRGRFQVIATIAADYERRKARLAVTDLLHTGRRLDGIFAVNDVMALGAADAVQAAGRQHQVKVIGFDGIPEALAAIGRGSLAATVAQYPYTMGELAVEACFAALRGDRLPARVTAPVQVIAQDNVAQARASFPRPPKRYKDPFVP
jgi:ABC-type sugar transport system substrate-binding protein